MWLPLISNFWVNKQLFFVANVGLINPGCPQTHKPAGITAVTLSPPIVSLAQVALNSQTCWEYICDAESSPLCYFTKFFLIILVPLLPYEFQNHLSISAKKIRFCWVLIILVWVRGCCPSVVKSRLGTLLLILFIKLWWIVIFFGKKKEML